MVVWASRLKIAEIVLFVLTKDNEATVKSIGLRIDELSPSTLDGKLYLDQTRVGI
jgi:hypothetical protein